MAIKTKAEILERIKAKFDGDASDEALEIIEDISDTMDDYDAKVKDTTDWKAEAERIDSEWREKYKERFFSGPGEDGDDPEPEFQEKRLTYEDLFKEEK